MDLGEVVTTERAEIAIKTLGFRPQGRRSDNRRDDRR